MSVRRPSSPAILRFPGFWSLVVAMLAITMHVRAAPALPPPGYRPIPVGVHALVGGTVIPRPGEKIAGGTIVIRAGLIEAVGRDLVVPADARVWDAKGLTIYAGFIEPFYIPDSKPPVDTTGITPIDAGSGVEFLGAETEAKTRRAPGPGAAIHGMTPQHRPLLEFNPGGKAFETLREIGFTAVNLTPGKGILRGFSSFINLGDGKANDLVVRPEVFQHAAFEPLADVYPHSLMGVIAGLRQTFLDADHYRRDHTHYELNPNGRARPDFNHALHALQPVFKGLPVLFEPGSSLMVERAAELARQFQLKLVLVACGEEWRRPELARAADAPFIVPVDFPTVPKLPAEEDWNEFSLDQLRRWDWAPENPAVLRRQGLRIALTTHGLGERKQFREKVPLAVRRGLSEDDALAALTTVPAGLCGVDKLLGTIEPGRIANLTVVEGGSWFDSKNKVREVWIDGRRYEVSPAKGKAASDKPAAAAKPTAEELKKQAREKDLLALQKKRTARPPQADRGALARPDVILVKGATLWTCGPQGTMSDADLLIVRGRIVAMGEDLSVQAEKAGGKGKVERIDGKGLHVTPGLIDCHSHTAILGGVNEATLPSTAMVRIQDVVNSETENLYQQLAGGLTVANLLHGSANPIGGQNAVIKLRFGESPSRLVFKEAPPGIKFALGENVKQANWGDDKTTRFPQSRMGVPTFHANRFTAARQYLAEWDRFRRENGAPPAHNLELETLAEIIQGRRLIHCHSYRQDEIIAFLRVMEQFGVRVATLQHVLEGYKVADEIARHGAGASAFSDWWAYKYEVIDAIPFAGSLMHARGALVSFNSDSSELARRMNLEAAKAVKYGGTPEAEALKFVTLNPARQLRVDRWVGSLEPGKHGDFALWSGSPLDSSAVCLQTWIEGRKYFDRSLAAGRAARRRRERDELIAKAKQMAELFGTPSGGEAKGGLTAFFKRIWETRHDLGVEDCLDCKTKGGAQ